jgi:hypothetical protein
MAYISLWMTGEILASKENLESDERHTGNFQEIFAFVVEGEISRNLSG